MEQPLIKVRNLKVIYNEGKPNEVRSLDDVSLEIYHQEYVIIFGPSGCGKSTLLYSISGLQAPSAGEVEVCGFQFSQIKKKQMVEIHQNRIGMVFQAFYLIPSLNILDNVCLPKIFVGAKGKERSEMGGKLLERFGISEQAHKFPGQLSGGQKQRVSIARSLINNPEIILADEPVGNLDSESAKNVLNILKELNEVDKKTVILVTHNPEHLYFADRVIFIRDGKIWKEEIHKEKRPVESLNKEGAETGEGEGVNISPELRMLMRTFAGLSPSQVGNLLVPYKADQLVSHILSALTEEQIKKISNSVRELLLKNYNWTELLENLDKDILNGGVGLNRTRALSFTHRAKDILNQADILKISDQVLAAQKLGDYLSNLFDLKIGPEQKRRLYSLLGERIADKIDGQYLRAKLDLSLSEGGIGLYKNTAEKVSREIEIIKFIHYES